MAIVQGPTLSGMGKALAGCSGAGVQVPCCTTESRDGPVLGTGPGVRPYHSGQRPPRNAVEYCAYLGSVMGRRPWVYIAGPMRGYPMWNATAFDEASVRWRAAGWDVTSPVESDSALGVDPRTVPVEELDGRAADPDWLRLVILGDVSRICTVQALALLPSWEKSTGSTVEVALAQFLGLPLFSAVTMDLLVPKLRPWSRLMHDDPSTAGRVLAVPGVVGQGGAQHLSGLGCPGTLGGAHEYGSGGRCRRCYQMDPTKG